MANDTHDNDNFDPWSSIGLQALLIVNRLRLQAQIANLEEQKPYEEHAQADDSSHRGEGILDQRAADDRRLGEIGGDVDRQRAGRHPRK